LSNLAGGPDGRCYATWIDLRSGRSQIYGALSRDGGKTWEANELVYESPEGAVCECCHPSVAFNPHGDLVVMWRNFVKGSRDLWSATRRMESDTFDKAVKQGSGTWKLEGCPMDGGAIFALDNGSFASVWRRDQAIYLSRQPTQEQRLGIGTQPVGVSAKGGVFIWWQQGSNLMHTTSAETNSPKVFAKDAKYAAAATSPKDGSVVVVFERMIGQRKSIFAEVIR
jgi:hypothetical protein